MRKAYWKARAKAAEDECSKLAKERDDAVAEADRLRRQRGTIGPTCQHCGGNHLGIDCEKRPKLPCAACGGSGHTPIGNRCQLCNPVTDREEP